MNTLDRRTFLGTVGAGMFAARDSFARSSRAANVKNVGVQLYSVRGELEKDFEGTLAKVAAIGYKEVEFAGYFNHTPEQVHDTLRKHGLSSPAAHVDYPTVSDPPRWAKALDDAATIGQKFLVNPWIDEAVRNQPDAWKRAADVYNAAAAEAQKHGIQFCYHNH